MARKNKAKLNGPVKIRTKKLSDGRLSLYLEIYNKERRERTYEFLSLYLLPGKVKEVKEKNDLTLIEADKCRLQRLQDLQRGDCILKKEKKSTGITLLEFLEQYKKEKEERYRQKHRNEEDAIPERANSLQKLICHLSNYGKAEVELINVDKEYCLDFISYLRNAKSLRHKSEEDHYLAPLTIRNYYEVLNSALKLAVRRDIIANNPLDKFDADERPSRIQQDRVYLTIDEVKRLIETSCYNEEIKRVFLFSCFCGLRYSDLCRLTWGNIITQSNPKDGSCRTSLSLIMKKTGKHIDIPLSKGALQWLPSRDNKPLEEKVFTLVSHCQLNKHISDWAKAAGLTKHVTMHVGRHTYATTLLALGAPIETISSLLGHTDISTTQIYAKVVNSKKNEAVDLFNNVFK